jgi:serine/threonine-protein kinase
MNTLHRLLPVLLVAALGASAAADHDLAPVPDLAGKSAAEAKSILEGAGFVPLLVDIADGTPGIVHSQVPAAGGEEPVGSEVEVRIGTALRVNTQAPDARGRLLAEAAEELSAAYVIDVVSVDGPEDRRGQVVDQAPAPGSALLFRGVLTLFVVQEAGPAGVTVPDLLGLPEGEARHLLEEAGLKVAVTYVDDPVAGHGIVVSQDPACCGEILVGGLVAIRVNGEAPPEPGPAGAVPVPPVVGLTMHDASQALLLLGLVPRLQFTVSPTSPWTAISQDPGAGVVAHAGDEVKVVIALPTAKPAQVRVPSLYGLSAASAAAVLGSLGLASIVHEEFSLFPVGRVFQQQPAPGTWVSAGSAVSAKVAKAPPGGWSPIGVQVPDLTGLSPNDALWKLVLSGLWGLHKKHVSPTGALGIVDAQHPAPGTVAAPGTVVKFYTPEEATVPPLVGLTKAAATAALTNAGLNGVAQGPAFGLGATKVTAQSHAAGTHVARGSTITFVYQFVGGPGFLKVKVPHLIGLTKTAAIQALQAKGLQGQLIGPAFGFGATQVTSQDPAPNVLVAIGFTVKAHYKFTGGPPAKVIVPNVIGMAKGAAAAALQAVGLQPHLVGPAFGFGGTEVVGQNPGAGTPVDPGSQVIVNWKYGGVILPNKVAVPNLIGLTKNQAAQALQAKGLLALFLGPAMGFGIPKVVAQAPAAGVLVDAGFTVKATIQYTGLALKVKVPTLLGLTKQQALNALQAVGLVANFQGPMFGFGATKVVGQSPLANALVDPGSTVTVSYIFVGFPPGPLVNVPNVIGKTRNQAKAILESKGFTVKVVGPFLGIGTPTVVGQNPGGGSDIPPGSQVTITIVFQL